MKKRGRCECSEQAGQVLPAPGGGYSPYSGPGDVVLSPVLGGTSWTIPVDVPGVRHPGGGPDWADTPWGFQAFGFPGGRRSRSGSAGGGA